MPSESRKIVLTDAQVSIAEIEEWDAPDLWQETADEARAWRGWMSARGNRNRVLHVDDSEVAEQAARFVVERCNLADDCVTHARSLGLSRDEVAMYRSHVRSLSPLHEKLVAAANP